MKGEARSLIVTFSQARFECGSTDYFRLQASVPRSDWVVANPSITKSGATSRLRLLSVAQDDRDPLRAYRARRDGVSSQGLANSKEIALAVFEPRALLANSLAGIISCDFSYSIHGLKAG